MKKTFYFLSFSFFISLFLGCGIYSFTGGNTGKAKTIQIDYFPNQASLVEPIVGQKFTEDLQDLFLRQTNLSLVKNNGDLHFQGEIVNYMIRPMGATANETAAQNRLTVTVNIRYTNRFKEEDDFEKQFSHYEDYNANILLSGSSLEDILNIIFERITQDVFNASVAKW